LGFGLTYSKLNANGLEAEQRGLLVQFFQKIRNLGFLFLKPAKIASLKTSDFVETPPKKSRRLDHAAGIFCACDES
jgi:hypothetical protein